MANERPTTDQAWEQTDALLRRALEVDPSQRAAFLRSATDDEALRARVESLLSAGDEASALFDQFAGRVVQPLAADLLGQDDALPDGPASVAGSTIDRYRILNEIARGGMGAVYLAERADAAYEQRVALKVLRRGLDTDDVVRRFRMERQILASLAHPNIARLIDGGSTPAGVPYLVMEYVDGERVDDYCDRHELTIEERLRLFAVVGRAVQHAHNRLVVHRDLKPSNILVTDDGTVKLLDFGVAKLLDDDAYPGEPARTRTGVRLLTPEYASPEQVGGEAVTTASDVYQLGLLLYDLLCDRTARDAARTGKSTTGATLRSWRPPSAAVGEEAARPRRTTPDRLRRLLRGDLDNIVLTALRDEPDRRYPSAMQLVEDIERYLGGLPVTAQADSRAYRARKFIRRHPAGVSAAAAFVLLLASSAAALAVQAGRLARQRDVAVAEAARAEEATNFLLSVFEAAEPNAAAGDTPSARDVLDAGAERVERELATQPALRAELSGTIGQIYLSLGMYDRASEILTRALEIHGEVGEPTASWARNLSRFAEASWTAPTESLLVLSRRAVEMAERAVGPDHPLVAELLVRLAVREDQLSWSGHENQELVPLVIEHLDRAIEILHRAEEDVRRELAFALNTRAYKATGDEQIALLREALDLRRDVFGPDHTVVAGNLNDLALALEETDPIASDSLMRQAAETYERVLGPEHAETLTIWNNFAGLRRDHGEFAAAAKIYERVLDTRRRVYPELEGLMGYTTYGLGVSYLGLGDHARAIEHLRETVRLLREAESLQQIARLSLARALAETGSFSEAEDELQAAIDWWGEVGDEQSVATARDQLAELYDAWGRPDRAQAIRTNTPSR